MSPTLARRASAASAGVTLVEDLGAADGLWREAAKRLVSSPYQSAPVCRAWFASEGKDFKPLLVIAGDPAAPDLVLPLAVAKTGPVAIARMPCGAHANYALPLFDAAVWGSDGAPDISRVLAAAAGAGGIDAFAFERVPAIWEGAANPLAALPGQAAVDPAWSTAIASDPASAVARLRGASALKKLRAKEKKLGEIGRVRWMRGETLEERRAIFAAFRAQKADWFARNRIPNAFEEAATLAFLTALTEDATCGLEWHALWAGERVAATDGVFLHRGRVSAALNSYDHAAFSRQSPGEILLREVITDAARRGFTAFDLGAGDFAYKKHWCDTNDGLRDVAIGFGPLGRLAAAAIRTERDLKRRIKADPRLRALADRLRGRGAAKED
jgi:CelD/BcsL family acetyltransferase involved in cellulose biosynthesis